MNKIAHYRQSAKLLATEPWCAVSFLYLTYVGIAAVDKYLLEGQPAKGALSWLWQMMIEIPQRPAVQLLMIPLSLWVFGKGIKRVSEQLSSDSAAKSQRLASDIEIERSIWIGANKLNIELSRIYGKRVDLDRLDSFIFNHRARLVSELGKLKSLESSDETTYNPRIMPLPFRHPENIMNPRIEIGLTHIDTPTWNPVWETGNPVSYPLRPMSDSMVFVKNESEAYFAAARQNSLTIENRLKKLEQIRDQGRAALKAAESAQYKASLDFPETVLTKDREPEGR